MRERPHARPREALGRARRLQRLDGIVLIGVLWIIALLSIVAAGMAVNMRAQARLAGNLVAAAQARHAAEGGVQLALMRLLAASDSIAGRTASEINDFEVGGARVRVAVTSENGKVDLNGAPEGLLDTLLQAAGVPTEARRSLVDAILDWRDADSAPRAMGAEDAQYAAAGRSYGAKDGWFDTIDELQLVLGMTPALYQTIRPALTVYARGGRVNPDAAPRLVLEALLNGTNTDVEHYLQRRGAEGQSNGTSPALPGSAIPFVGGAVGITYSVHAHARVGREATAHATAVVEVRNRDRSQPLKVRDWRRDGESLFAETDTSAHSPDVRR